MLSTGAYGTHHLEKCPFFPLPQHITTSLRGKVDGLFMSRKISLPIYFPSGWDVLLNSHREGLKIAYPVMMRTYMSKSPPKYTTQSTTDGVDVVLDHYNHYEHKVSLVFTKTAA